MAWKLVKKKEDANQVKGKPSKVVGMAPPSERPPNVRPHSTTALALPCERPDGQQRSVESGKPPIPRGPPMSIDVTPSGVKLQSPDGSAIRMRHDGLDLLSSGGQVLSLRNNNGNLIDGAQQQGGQQQGGQQQGGQQQGGQQLGGQQQGSQQQCCAAKSCNCSQMQSVCTHGHWVQQQPACQMVQQQPACQMVQQQPMPCQMVQQLPPFQVVQQQQPYQVMQQPATYQQTAYQGFETNYCSTPPPQIMQTVRMPAPMPNLMQVPMQAPMQVPMQAPMQAPMQQQYNIPIQTYQSVRTIPAVQQTRTVHQVPAMQYVSYSSQTVPPANNHFNDQSIRAINGVPVVVPYH